MSAAAAAAAADHENPVPNPSPPSDQNTNNHDHAPKSGPTPKKQAWNRPHNGSAHAAGPVMGASWPALSESAKHPSFKVSATAMTSDLNKSVSDLSAVAAVGPAVVGNVGSPRMGSSNSVTPAVSENVSSPRMSPGNSVTPVVSGNVGSPRMSSSNSVTPAVPANVSSPRMSSSNPVTPVVSANASSPRMNLSNSVSPAVLANAITPRTSFSNSVAPEVSANVGSPKLSSSNSVTPTVSAIVNSPNTSSSNSVTPAVSANVSSPPKLNLSNSVAPEVPANVSSAKSNLSNSSALNHAPPARQKSMRRGNANNTSSVSGSSSGGSSGGAVSPSPPASLGVSPRATQDRQAAPQILPQGNNLGNWDRGSRGGGSGSQFHGNNDHHRGNGGNRRGNNGGGGTHHNNYNNNRDQERRNYDSYHHRGYGGREVHMQQWESRPYTRPPQNAQIANPFISPVPVVRPLGNPMVYNADVPMIYLAPQQPPEPFAGLPFITYPPAQSVYFPPQIDPQRDILLKQIEYYFSNENLCKDTYFRQQMDGDGWVLASVIARFNRVKALTDSITFILETVASSTLLEVQGEKMRRRNDWMNWVLPTSNSLTTVSGQQIVPTPDLADLSVSLQTVGLGTPGIENMRISAHGEVEYSRSASGNLSKQFSVVGDVNQDGNEQFTGHINADGSQAIKSLSRSGTL